MNLKLGVHILKREEEWHYLQKFHLPIPGSWTRMDYPIPNGEKCLRWLLLCIPFQGALATADTYYSEYKTLPHMLGSYPQGELLRIKRHNIIRSMLASALRVKGLEVYDAFHCVADDGSNHRIDIIAIDRKKGMLKLSILRLDLKIPPPNLMK